MHHSKRFPKFLPIENSRPFTNEYRDITWLGEGTNAVVVSLKISRISLEECFVLRIPKPLQIPVVMEHICRDVTFSGLDLSHVNTVEYVVDMHYDHIRYIVNNARGCPHSQVILNSEPDERCNVPQNASKMPKTCKFYRLSLFKKWSCSLHMFLEECKNVSHNGKIMDTESVCIVLEDVCKALSRLHANNLIHMDIHTGNILVDCTSKQRQGGTFDYISKACIIDFDLSLRNGQPMRPGNGLWDAWRKCPRNISKMFEASEDADIHALGLCIKEMLSAFRQETKNAEKDHYSLLYRIFEVTNERPALIRSAAIREIAIKMRHSVTRTRR